MNQLQMRTERPVPISSIFQAGRPRRSGDRIRLLIADGHALFRQTLRRALEADGGFQVVAEAGDGREALEAIESIKPDIALVDFGMSLLNGLEIARRTIKAGSSTKIVLLASRSEEPLLMRILFAGVAGCLLKEADYEELVLALRKVHAGYSYLTPSLEVLQPDRRVRRRRDWDPDRTDDLLTDRERELLQLVGEGYTNREIAQQLCVSVKTVEAHKANICGKLNLRSGAGLVRHAIHAGLVAI